MTGGLTGDPGLEKVRLGKMRLVCPNCDAQYEVVDSAIPAAGRDVQCSACGHGWFHRPTQDAAIVEQGVAPPLPEAATPAPQAASLPKSAAPADPAAPVVPPPRRPLDESVIAVLREEALREAAVRRAEMARAAEARPDPAQVASDTTRQDGDAAAAPGPFSAPAPLAATPQPVLAGRPPVPVAGVAADPVPAAPRRDLLPDIEEINSSLSASSERRRARTGDAVAQPAARSGSGFRTGFLAMLICCALLAVTYVLAPRLAERFPGSAPAAQSYVATVDGLRAALSRLVERARVGLGASSVAPQD